MDEVGGDERGRRPLRHHAGHQGAEPEPGGQRDGRATSARVDAPARDGQLLHPGGARREDEPRRQAGQQPPDVEPLRAVVTGDEHADRRAWHRAAASVAPDPDVVDELEQAARRARRRGAFATAALALERAAALRYGSGPTNALTAHYEADDDYMRRGMNALPRIRVVLQLVDARWAAEHAR